MRVSGSVCFLRSLGSEKKTLNQKEQSALLFLMAVKVYEGIVICTLVFRQELGEQLGGRLINGPPPHPSTHPSTPPPRKKRLVQLFA